MAICRAKLQVSSIEKNEDGSEKITMYAVCGNFDADGYDENNSYANYTPMADFVMLVNNPNLYGKFEPQQEYYVDFTLAEKEQLPKENEI